MKLTLLYRRRWGLLYLPVIAAAGTALWYSATVWTPLPPQHVVISAGSPQGSYARLAQRYADKLESDGLRVEVIYSDTPRAAMDRVLASDASNTAVFGFAQGMDASAHPALQALAVIGQEPVWVFSGPGGAPSLAQARGLRVAAGPPASPSRRSALAMLAQEGVTAQELRLDPATGMAAANALLDGKVDMVIEAAGEDDESVQLLTRSGGVQLLGTDHAGALAAQRAGLKPLLLPQGAIELRGDVPPRDLTLMSLQTHLVLRPDTHPALQREILDAATAIHEVPGFLQRHGQFPGFRGNDFPLTPAARDFSQGERPWLEELLPYRKAQWAELVLYAVLPIVLIALLLLAWIPRVFDWRVNSALHNFYGELKFLEAEIDQVASHNPMVLRSLLERLDQIEQQVIAVDLPAEFSERWYTLREHLAAARERLLKLRAR